jgi:organic radical activating enzyme
MHEHVERADEIPLNKMLEILENIKSIGVKAVTYSGGGEPLSHKNIQSILKKTLELKLIYPCSPMAKDSREKKPY